MALDHLRSGLAGLAALLAERGPADATRYLVHRAREELADRRLGVRTTEFVDTDALGYANTDLIGHAPVPYRALLTALEQVPVRPTDVLLDYGAGLGRAVIVAATLPIAGVIGVELSPALAGRARQNVARAGSRLRAPVTIVQGDAREFVVPPEVTIVHAYNPFRGAVLADVIARIRASLRAHPRELTIVFGNPAQFEQLAAGAWIERRWFQRFYPDTGYGVYRATAS